MTRAPTSYREEGAGQPNIAVDWRKSPPLTAGAVGATMQKYLGSYTRHIRANEHVYANMRTLQGASPKPRYIVSDVGIVSNNGINKNSFSWLYLPPKAGGYKVTPNGVVRPWSFLFIHSFGYTWDAPYMGIDKYAKRKSLHSRLAPPGDDMGHHPSRWFAGIKELTKSPALTRGKPNPVSIHFCISRRGDVVVSTDLNDIAYHGGGRLLHPRKSNNTVSVGFELEPQIVRHFPFGPTHVAPFTTPQMTALAIVCKKLDTWRPTKQVYITRRSAESHKDFAQTLRLATQHGSGYVQHSDVSPVYRNAEGKLKGGKVDAGAQFNILPGERAQVGSAVWNGTGVNATGLGEWRNSGWTELWGLMKRVRKFRAADQLFVSKVPDVEFALMKEFAEAVQQSNAGQRATLTSMQDRIAGLRRAANMQSRKRRATYAKALAHGTALSNTVALTTAAVSRSLIAFDLSSLEAPTGDVMSYDYTTGTWRVGGADTGRA